MNIIMLMMALCASLTYFGAITSRMSIDLQQRTMTNQIQLEAQELLTFTLAAMNYSQGAGTQLTPGTMTVSALQAANLLPASFPPKTPFGQNWEADFVTDAQNGNVLDLVIRTSGDFAANFQTLANSIPASRDVAAQVIEKLEELQKSATSNQFLVGSNSAGVAMGMAYMQSFTALFGSSIPDLSAMINTGGYTPTNTYVPMIFIQAPNQQGFWVFSLYGYGCNGMTGQIIYTSGNASVVYPYASFSKFGISSQGWRATCPSIATNLGTSPEVDDLTGNNTLYDASGNVSQSALFCIPAYKGDVSNIQNGINAASGSQTFGQSTWQSTEEIVLNRYAIPNYIDPVPPVFLGPVRGGASYTSNPPPVNTTLYSKSGMFTIQVAPAPDIAFIPGTPMVSLLQAIGFKITVDGDTYQFANLISAVLTGQGQPDATTGKDIWGMDLADVNLNNSQESYSVLWRVQKNPPDSGGSTFIVPYRTTEPDASHGCSPLTGVGSLSIGGARIYQCSYSARIPTPQVN